MDPWRPRARRARAHWLALAVVASCHSTAQPAPPAAVVVGRVAPLDPGGANGPAPSAAPSPPPPVPASPTEAPSSGERGEHDLIPLARAGAACRQCFFNARCALLVDADESDELPCCDYAAGTRLARPMPSGEAARCVSVVVGAPVAPSPARDGLHPLARPKDHCQRCAFDTHCTLRLDASADPALPCCDYAGGATAEAWPDGNPEAARCLSTRR